MGNLWYLSTFFFASHSEWESSELFCPIFFLAPNLPPQEIIFIHIFIIQVELYFLSWDATHNHLEEKVDCCTEECKAEAVIKVGVFSEIKVKANICYDSKSGIF